MNYNEFDLFTADDIKKKINHDIGNALDLFADSYVAIYRIAHDLKEHQKTMQKQNEELRQALNLCIQCLKLVETTAQDRK
ncbi:hypothetical protein [Bacillus sp. FSL K6-3431]|uniref:hypothetical protein n=1 Tax=Bacillus sp. FSL K6-3431 TaxID=2921500 RepID=UPI0030F7971E